MSLVDPDNRRRVGFSLRHRLLDELPRLTVEAIWRRREEGLPKLWLIRQTLTLRRRHPEWFDTNSPYLPMQARGDQAEHLLAFQRGGAITVVPRLLLSLSHSSAPANGDRNGRGTAGVTEADWGDTVLVLPAGTWRNELTSEPIPSPLARKPDLLTHFPVAMLSRREKN